MGRRVLRIGVIAGIIFSTAAKSETLWDGLIAYYAEDDESGHWDRAGTRSTPVNWLPGIGGPLCLLGIGLSGGISELFLLSTAASLWGLLTGMGDLLELAGNCMPRISDWGPVVVAAIVFATFSEFYLASVWRPWPFVQCAIAMLAFSAGAVGDSGY